MKRIDLVNRLKSLNSALIFCHARPDGDTLSSAFSLKTAFEKCGKKADVVCADPIPEKYKNCGFIGEFSSGSDEYDAHIAVDCASENMIGELYSKFASHKETYCIDHHVSNTRYAKHSYVACECANAVNVYDIIVDLGVEIDEKLANTIYLGICTDSGNFSQSNTDAKALFVASKLAEAGANPAQIYNAMFKCQSVARAKLYGEIIGKIKFFHDDRLGLIVTRLADLEKYGVDKSVTEGFVDFPLTVGKVEVAVSIVESGDKCFKISFRSKKDVDVNAVAATFGGGGHVRASGAMLNGYLEDVIDKIVFTVGNYL